ncbi:MAG: ParA family protein [Caldilineales bacterium]|nr:ParA family protein [Caldilineales bacterium]MDW8316887.1 ParA family protein [Anaerolineae bacterium]
MARIYALVNQKGGVGKTTTAVNLAACLAAAGRQVLLVDCDPQANATSSLGVNPHQQVLTLYDVLIDRAPAARAVVPTAEAGLSLLPSAPRLAGAEVEMVSLMAREHLLKRALAPIADGYSHVLLDCPPSLGLLTVNALTAASAGVIIPIQCEYLPLEGLGRLTETIRLVQDALNPNLRIFGLVLTMFDGRTNLSQQVVAEVRRYFPQETFRTIIPRSVRISEAPSYGQPITRYAPGSPGALAYEALARELLTREDGAGRRQL